MLRCLLAWFYALQCRDCISWSKFNTGSSRLAVSCRDTQVIAGVMVQIVLEYIMFSVSYFLGRGGLVVGISSSLFFCSFYYFSPLTLSM